MPVHAAGNGYVRHPTASRISEPRLVSKLHSKKQQAGSSVYQMQSQTSRLQPKKASVSGAAGAGTTTGAEVSGKAPRNDISPYKSIFQQKKEVLLNDACKMLNYKKRIDTMKQNFEFERKLEADRDTCRDTYQEIQRVLKEETEIQRHVSTNLGFYSGHQITLQEMDSSSNEGANAVAPPVKAENHSNPPRRTLMDSSKKNTSQLGAVKTVKIQESMMKSGLGATIGSVLK